MDPPHGSIDAPPVDPPSTPDKLGLVQLAVGFCVALGAMLAFALVAINITNQEAVALDTFANPFLHSIASPVLDGVMNAITSLGSGPVLGLLFVLVAGAAPGPGSSRRGSSSWRSRSAAAWHSTGP